MSKGNTLVLVAVRLKSTRLPRKALEDLAGKPLILRLNERLRKTRLVDEIIWCTSTNPDDDLLEELAVLNDIPLYRGSELDVLSRFMKVAWSRNAKTVIRVTGDNPLTDPLFMDLMIREHNSTCAEYTYTDDLPRGTRCEIIEVSALEKCHSLVKDPTASEYMTLMLRRPDHFKVIKVNSPDRKINRPELRLTVDTPEDLYVIREIYNAFNGEPPELSRIINWLDAHPDVKKYNQHIIPREIDSSINVQFITD